MKIYIRNLTDYQIARCANAKLDYCSCRCQHLLHGKDHTKFVEDMDILLENDIELTEDIVWELAGGMSVDEIIRKELDDSEEEDEDNG